RKCARARRRRAFSSSSGKHRRRLIRTMRRRLGTSRWNSSPRAAPMPRSSGPAAARAAAGRGSIRASVHFTRCGETSRLCAMRALYVLLLHLITPLVLLRLLWKSRLQPEYRQRIGERFGRVPPAPGGVAVWVHAVSVGESLAALPLIEALIRQHGEGRVWVTTTTPTGSARVSAALGGRVRHSYAPYDLPGAVARFLDRARPRQVVIMETELWPTLFRAVRRRGLPLFVVNARLSPRSFRGYGRLRRSIGGVLADCTEVAAQS